MLIVKENHLLKLDKTHIITTTVRIRLKQLVFWQLKDRRRTFLDFPRSIRLSVTAAAPFRRNGISPKNSHQIVANLRRPHVVNEFVIIKVFRKFQSFRTKLSSLPIKRNRRRMFRKWLWLVERIWSHWLAAINHCYIVFMHKRRAFTHSAALRVFVNAKKEKPLAKAIRNLLVFIFPFVFAKNIYNFSTK